MSSPLKIGAVSGLVAGIVGGIVYSGLARIAANMGLFEAWWRQIIPGSIGSNLLVSIVFGVIIGIIYSRAYSVIPGKGILKGLVYGLILILVVPIRIQSFMAPYGYFLDAIGQIFSNSLAWIAYCLVLGFLYEHLRSRFYPIKEEPKIITYDMKSGLLPGAIAGIADGIVTSLVNPIAFVLGLFKWPGAPTTLTFEFWISQSGSHILMNLIWDIVFGAMFARVYNVVPGKGLVKGLCYSLIVVLVASLQLGAYALGWGLSYSLWPLISSSLWGIFISIPGTGIALGLVLGALYKKPSD